MSKLAFLKPDGTIGATSTSAFELLESAESTIIARIDDNNAIKWVADANWMLREFALDMASEAMILAEEHGVAIDPHVKALHLAGRMHNAGKITTEELNIAYGIARVIKDKLKDGQVKTASDTVFLAFVEKPTSAAHYTLNWALRVVRWDGNLVKDHPRVVVLRDVYIAALDEMLLELAPVKAGGGTYE